MQYDRRCIEMILVFTDTRVYHDEWEMNPKRVHSSLIVSWGSAYQPRKKYQFYDCFNILQPYMSDDDYEWYINNDNIFKYERAILGFALSSGIDLVFLTNENYRLYDRLYVFLCNVQEAYGIAPVYVKSIEDIPLFPRTYDYFNIAATETLQEDIATIQQYLKENPEIKEEFERRIKHSENLL